jgi:F0F1-type ATP synthase assembly protein I
MMQFLLKVLISALLIAGASELARRSSIAGALLASLPLTSILALIWLWHDGTAPAQIADFAGNIFWLVLPSLVLFIVTPLLLRAGWSFWPSLGAGCAATVAGYAIGLYALQVWTQHE